MERPLFKPEGTPVEALDTPALIVDLAALERNIETVHRVFRDGDRRLRPEVEVHRCPAIAQMQLAAGGTVGGVCVTTLGQAEVFCANGISDVLLAGLVVTPSKLARLFALARRATVTVAVDDEANVRQLSEAALASSAGVSVVVAVAARPERIGVEPGPVAVALARAVADAEGLDFAGLMSHDPDATDGEVQRVLDTREMVERAGMEVRVLSVSGASDYDVATTMDGVTEVAAGSYALMDHNHRARHPELEPAARVMTTVTSVPAKGLAITDGGHKSIGGDLGPPFVENVPGGRARGLSAEHFSIDLDSSSTTPPRVGDKVWLTPGDMGTCVNLHDYIHGVRDGRLEVVWEIAARGAYR